MWALHSVLIGIFDILFLPFRGLNPWFGMIFISLLTAFLMLWIYRTTSNQEGIRKTKNTIKAHLLELRLFKDNMRISLRAQGRIFRANMRYIGHNTKPLLVMIIPLVLILSQLNLRFGFNPLRPGEDALVKIRTDQSMDPVDLSVTISASNGLSIETPAVRIADEREIAWRIRAVEAGQASLTFETGGRSITKSLNIAGKSLSVVSPVRHRNSLNEILFSGEKTLPKDLPLRSIEILYQPGKLNLFGLNIHWIIAYLILSIVFGFAFKGVFKVEI